MTTRYATIGVFGLSFLISATSPFVETARAQMPPSCDEAIASRQAALDQFGIDAPRESIGFVLDDARRSALSLVRGHLAGTRTLAVLDELRQRWDDHNSFIGHLRSLQDIFAEVSRCLTAGGPRGCWDELTEWSNRAAVRNDRAREAMNAYIESLENESTSNAAARVERAEGVLQNLTTRAANLTLTGQLSSDMQACFGDFEREVEASRTATAQPQPRPLPPTLPPTQPPTQPPAPPVDLSGDSGGGVNPIVPIAIVGGAGFGTWYALDKSGVFDNLFGGGGSCISTRNCVVNSFSGGCSCSGTTNGPCDFSGTPGGVGASCVSGTPCRSGLQCTNGRCEMPPGRC